MSWDLRNSNTASKYTRLQYTTNGTDFIDFQVITMPPETWVNGQSASFVGVPGVENNPKFGVRFVTELESTALSPNPGSPVYVPCSSTNTYGTAGTLRFDMVLFAGDSTVTNFSVLTYNILGNGATGWTLTSPNVQAIGRQLSYLQPDVVGFQEVPEDFRLQMTNFIGTYLPGYFVAVGSSTGGGERSSVASRYPIVRSKSWLVNQDLTSFGYAGDFTRDLFEAQIAMPGFAQPFHCFTTHLKAFADETSATRRGAEARCISNFFVTAYQATNALRPCVLVGDMNEDIYEPRTYEQQAVQTMTSTPTGLKVTDPRNPVTNDDDTWSAQNANPSIRFDYVLPNGILFSNLASGQVFRSDKVSPLVPPLLATDSATASDHYPVLLVFNSSYETPFISAFAHQTILANTSTTNIAFTIGDLQTNPTNLTVNVYSAHPTLLPPSGITLGGSGANRTLRLTPATNEAGASWITVVVSDGALSASSSFMLKVLRPQIITLWDFNSNPPDNNTSTGTLLPGLGAGTAASVGTATNSLNSNVAPVSFDPNLTDNSKWRLGQFPAQGHRQQDQRRGVPREHRRLPEHCPLVGPLQQRHRQPVLAAPVQCEWRQFHGYLLRLHQPGRGDVVSHRAQSGGGLRGGQQPELRDPVGQRVGKHRHRPGRQPVYRHAGRRGLHHRRHALAGYGHPLGRQHNTSLTDHHADGD